MKKIGYYEPRDAAEASRILSEEENSFVLAGGTNILLLIRKGVIEADSIVNIKRIPSMRGIRIEGDEVAIGALTTLSELHENVVIRETFPLLVEAISTMASRRVRNIATIGGNICNASPAADSAPALLCLDARIVSEGTNGQRTIPINEFFIAPGRTVLGRDEIVTQIRIPVMFRDYKCAFYKFGLRQSLDIAIASVSMAVLRDGKSVKDARIALGSVAPTPIRSHEAERVLLSSPLSVEEVGHAASLECSPVDDIRASGNYRREIINVLTKRCLQEVAV